MSIGIATLGMFHPPSASIMTGGGGAVMRIEDDNRKKPTIQILKITEEGLISKSLNNLITISSIKEE